MAPKKLPGFVALGPVIHDRLGPKLVVVDAECMGNILGQLQPVFVESSQLRAWRERHGSWQWMLLPRSQHRDRCIMVTTHLSGLAWTKAADVGSLSSIVGNGVVPRGKYYKVHLKVGWPRQVPWVSSPLTTTHVPPHPTTGV